MGTLLPHPDPVHTLGRVGVAVGFGFGVGTGGGAGVFVGTRGLAGTGVPAGTEDGPGVFAGTNGSGVPFRPDPAAFTGATATN